MKRALGPLSLVLAFLTVIRVLLAPRRPRARHAVAQRAGGAHRRRPAGG